MVCCPFTLLPACGWRVVPEKALCVLVCVCVVCARICQLEGQENPLMFAQLFQIVVDESGPFVAADIFRLNYG